MAYRKRIDRGVFAALDSPTATTVTTASTYYPIAGTFSNTPIENFSLVAGPAIQYDGCETRYFEVDWHSTCYAANNGRTVYAGIKKNGTLVSDSIMSTYLKNATQEYAFSGTSVVELTCNDQLQLVTSSDVSGAVITFTNFTTTIREFF